MSDTSLVAARAFVEKLPLASRLEAAPHSGPVDDVPSGEAVATTLVGATSADLAVVFADPRLFDEVAADTPGVAVADLLAPALSAAADAIAPGVLGEVRSGDAAALFADPTTRVHDLVDAEGLVVGWLAVAIRERDSSAAFDAGSLSRIQNVEMALTVEIGRTRRTVRDVLGLVPGSIVELDRSAGAPADILLNGRLIAHGEVVVVDQDYAVRVTRILDSADGAA